MAIISFDGYPQNLEAYGGRSCFKLGINYNGERYMIKFPANLKDRQLKNVERSYSNSPVSEYIGSHIYEALGIPVHETVLGIRDKKVVVGCKDIRKKQEELIEFARLKVTFSPTDAIDADQITNGVGTELESILNTIEKHPILKKIDGVKERFWDMFIVDALIGNTDRNNGNWGILKDAKDNLRLAPVYDNGNSFANKMSEAQMEKNLQNSARMEDLAYIARTCVFKKYGRCINPYQYILKMENQDCNEALHRIFSKLDMKKLNRVIDETPVIGKIEKEFYKKLLDIRYQKVLLPAYERIRKEYQIEAVLPKQNVGERKKM